MWEPFSTYAFREKMYDFLVLGSHHKYFAGCFDALRSKNAHGVIELFNVNNIDIGGRLFLADQMS